MRTFQIVVMMSLLAAEGIWAANPSFSVADDWKIVNFHERLRLELSSGQLVAHGATNTCDTALSLVSRRMPLAADAAEFVVSFEAHGTRLCMDVYRKGGSWNNAILWYDKGGKLLDEAPLAHLVVPAARAFRQVRDWGRIPAGAVACAIRLGFDNPNLVGDAEVAYRNFAFETFTAAHSQAAMFEKAWADQSWLCNMLYPGEAAPVPKITLRDDGVTLVDGEAFFPIGIYSVCRREFNGKSFDTAFRDLKAAGFNFAHTYGDAYDPEFLAAAQKYGFKLWVASKLPDEKLLNIGRYHPSILAWYLGDDTSAWFSPQEITDRHAAVKAVDPNRLTCQADPVHPERLLSCYGAYVRATDVFMPEIYPVRGEAGDPSDTNCVAKTVWDMEQVRADVRAFNDGQPRACWPILQWFCGWNSWAHFPSKDQLFATTWAAIVHGAHGMTWYTYGGFDMKKPGRNNQGITSSPERWQAISELATLLKRHSPILLTRTPLAQPRVEIVSGPKQDALGRYASVTCLLKTWQGKNYLYAVNAAAESVTARFTLPDGSVRTETFAPLGYLVPTLD